MSFASISYDLFLERPVPLVPLRLIKEVDERVDYLGNVKVPLDVRQVSEAVSELAAAGVTAIGVGFLHSYMHSDQERRAGAVLATEYPELAVSLSSQVAGEIREFERFSTTVANAYTQPMTRAYLGMFEEKLGRLGVRCPLRLMLSNGGIASMNVVREFPVRLIESGPAAGALAASFFSRLAGTEDALAFDMGGTTVKVCLIEGGEPRTTFGFEVARTGRLKKGSGLPLRTAALDLIEVGAGGGSVARVDGLGLLVVGPESAGADPGPACYGRGGQAPTVTDADLVLGYLDAASFLGGDMRLDLDAALSAIRLSVADPLGVDEMRGAWGIHDLVNENMASAIRVHLAERGQDPRECVLVATGGAGPVHAWHVARKLDISRVICPFMAGVASCVGMLVAPPRIDVVQSYPTRLTEVDWVHLERLYDQMAAELKEHLRAVDVSEEQMILTASADMRYVGQGHEITVVLQRGAPAESQLALMQQAFEDSYRRTFGRTIQGLPLEVVSWRLIAQGPPPSRDALGRHSPFGAGSLIKGTRLVYFPEFGARRETPVYDRYSLTRETSFHGPAVIEERESTVVAGPRTRCHLDDAGNLLLDVGA